MQPKTQKWLNDIRNACIRIERYTSGVSLDSYEENDLLQAGVERYFEIIGEALRRVEAAEPGVTSSITDYRAIIGFRNLLAHGYDIIDNERVWFVITVALPRLHREVEQLLGAG